MPVILVMLCSFLGLVWGESHGLELAWGAGVGAAAVLAAYGAQGPWLPPLLLGLATSAWMALLGAQGAIVVEPAVATGVARLSVEVLRTGCGEGCWSEARLLACKPLDPDTCPEGQPRLALTTDNELPVGAHVTLLAKVSSQPRFRNPLPSASWPDARVSLRARAVSSAAVRIDQASWLADHVMRLRGAIRRAFVASLSEPHAGIARALLLGEGMAVSSELNDAIRNAGVSHVLAVSGMHVTVLAGALVSLLRLCWLWSPLGLWFEARRAASALGVALSPLVAMACGGAPSAWRSAFTSSLLYGLVALGYRPNALHVSAFAVVLHALYEPRDALHPGFVLSVLATGALLTAAHGSGGIRGAFKESVRAWLATAPFLGLCFGTTSVIALVANVVLLPLGGVLIPLVVAQLFAAAGGASDALGTRWAFETASGAFLHASRVCSNLDPGLTIPPLTLTQGLLAAGLSFVWLTGLSLRPKLLASVLACLGFVACEWHLRHELSSDELRVTFVDVGQGDAVLIESGSGSAALVDAGGAVQGGPDPGSESVVPLLRARRIGRLDAVILSHPHPDHYGGLFAVLDAVEVGELWDTGQAEAEGGSGAATQLLKRALERGVRIVRPAERCGQAFPLGGAALRVLSPCPGFDEALDANDNSWVIRLTHGERSFLLMGDAEHATETSLVERTPEALASDVLKVGHHGSRTSSTPAFLARVSPWLSVISAGRANRFGHPHADVMERLQSASQHVLRTDVVGGVRVTSDGRKLSVDAWDPAVLPDGSTKP
ncbi:MAG: DNA internalization-related competence protein ComEC/Rec2 [Myxococcales bacterium]